MSRVRAFDVDIAVDKAMNLFWSNGYKATSLQDLIVGMGISKSSFYETFGSKHDLFLTAIDRYVRNVSSQVMGAANMDAPAVKVIRALFDRAVQRMLDGESRRGCFLNNCAVEVSIHDDAAADRVAEGLDIMEEALYRLVLRGQAEGGISRHIDARATARFLTANLNGILVLGKVYPDEDRLSDVADIAMKALK